MDRRETAVDILNVASRERKVMSKVKEGQAEFPGRVMRMRKRVYLATTGKIEKEKD